VRFDYTPLTETSSGACDARGGTVSMEAVGYWHLLYSYERAVL